jgi:hypothetical protein
MVRKDAAASSQARKPAPAVQQQPRVAQSSTQESFPAVLPSTVVNIALHSLFMVTVPFALFFASHFGALDRESPKHCDWRLALVLLIRAIRCSSTMLNRVQ